MDRGVCGPGLRGIHSRELRCGNDSRHGAKRGEAEPRSATKGLSGRSGWAVEVVILHGVYRDVRAAVGVAAVSRAGY